MKIAYLILAHNHPRHLHKLVNALSTESSAFFIHADKKSKVEFGGGWGSNVHFSTRRIAVYWAHFSVVAASLALMDLALADTRRFDRLVLLSGQCFPLRPGSYMENFFTRHSQEEFIQARPMPQGKPLEWITRHHIQPDGLLGWILLQPFRRSALDRLKAVPPPGWLERFVMRAVLRAGAFSYNRDYKKYLGSLAPHGGSAWWALSADACRFIQTFVREQTGVVRFFRGTHCPDETFYQTILANSPFRPQLRHHLMCADWGTNDCLSPHLMNKAFLKDVLASELKFEYRGLDGRNRIGEVLFARKFSAQNEDVVEFIEREIAAQG